MNREIDAEQTAERLLENFSSAFASDAQKKVWLKTAMLGFYATGRSDVFHEENNFICEQKIKDHRAAKQSKTAAEVNFKIKDAT